MTQTRYLRIVFMSGSWVVLKLLVQSAGKHLRHHFQTPQKGSKRIFEMERNRLGKIRGQNGFKIIKKTILSTYIVLTGFCLFNLKWR